jgi:hypothetical protein
MSGAFVVVPRADCYWAGRRWQAVGTGAQGMDRPDQGSDGTGSAETRRTLKPRGGPRGQTLVEGGRVIAGKGDRSDRERILRRMAQCNDTIALLGGV